MNKVIKDAFAKIKVPECLDEKILNLTVNRKRKHFRQAYVYPIIAVVCLLSLTIVNAKEIGKIIDCWNTSIRLEDGREYKISENNNFKDIPSTAIKINEHDDSLKLTYQELEEMLDFSILKLPENNTDEIYYRTELNENGTIGRVDLWFPYFVKKSDNKFISASVSMLNKYADESYINAFQEGLDASGEKQIEESYKSKNLDTKVILFINKWSNERLTATFVHDDILYRFIGENITQDEMISIIETLKL